MVGSVGYASKTRLTRPTTVDLLRVDAGGAVALVWLVVDAGGRRLPEPTWVDRAGRVLGVTWLILTPVTVPGMFVG